MEQFKLKSIDELDLEFVNSSRAQKSQAQAPQSLIPEISKNEPVKKSDETIGAHYFQKPAQPVTEQPVYKPEGQTVQKKARPLVPIGQTPSPYAPVGAAEENLDFSDANYGIAKTDDIKNKKGSKGALAGKIISIILLCATVIVFLLGCFVTIFLDNNGSDIGGICFNTMGQDIAELGVSKGDLIISKKVEASEYATGDLIAVPASYFEGCDIQSITAVTSYSDSAQITTTAMSGGVGYSSSVMSSNCYGVVSSYIPALGGLLNFAMENAILVCILFVLLAAFWCLLLVLLEKSSTKSLKEKPKKNKA